MHNKVFLSVFVLASVLVFPVHVSAQPADPCPDAQIALRNTPDDLSKVQADIDRLTLCVERAQLLQRLNALATENEDDLMGADVGNPGFSLGGEQDFEPFDRNAVLQAAQPDIVPVPVQDANGEELIIDTDDWVILSVFGSGENLNAKLAKADGSFAQVKANETLPDGGEVLSVSSSFVSVKEDGKTRKIYWYERP